MTDDPVKQAWQASVEIAGAPPLEEVRKGADKFYRFVRWRNASEYAACLLVLAGFGYYLFVLPHLLQKVGSALILVATCYVAWQLHRRASAEPPERAGELPIIQFQRQQFARHRDALRSIFWWYMLPFLPGLLVMSAGGAVEKAGGDWGAVQFSWPGAVLAGAFVAAGLGIWWFNQRIANKLQRYIDEIDALTGVGG